MNNKTTKEGFSDSDMRKAIARFVKITKEQQEQNGVGDNPIAEGAVQPALFKEKEIRRTLYHNEWYFSVVDIIEALTGTTKPRRYWSDLKRQLSDNEGYSELYENIVQLKMPSADGKFYETDTASVETIFRLLQSIPTKKAEPFKKWLARVGYERIQEIQNPEIAIKRAMLTYKVKGYSDEWINARIQTIVSRKDLTNEWQKRGIRDGFEYALLTDAISLGTFGISTKQHKALKLLGKQHSLRDHMHPVELALTMLGETVTAEIARTTDARGFVENQEAARSGGEVAGSARKDIEKRTGKKVVTDENYLPPSKKLKK